MQKMIEQLIERFPERAQAIRNLCDTSLRFKDLVGDHYEVSAALSRMDAGERESQAAQFDALQRRRADLEEELILIMENHQRP